MTVKHHSHSSAIIKLFTLASPQDTTVLKTVKTKQKNPKTELFTFAEENLFHTIIATIRIIKCGE